MALIYQKTVGDKTLILAPREFILRPFDFQLWTEMRFGIYFTAVTSAGDDTSGTTESVSVSTAADLIAFGLKDSASNDLPGFGAALFLGAVTRNAEASKLTTLSGFSSTSSLILCAAGYHETTLVGGTVSQSIEQMGLPAASGSTGYNGFYCLKFVITNRGLSSQAVAISSVTTTPIAGTDYSAQALRLLMNNASFGSASTIAWNDGAVARTIPDAIYIRMPFYSNRIRISAMRAIRYAP